MPVTVYQKKPIKVEAFQLTLERYKDNTHWPWWLSAALLNNNCEDEGKYISYAADGCMLVCTLGGGMCRVEVDDYIIRGVEGELYPCTREIFEKTHEPALD